MSLDRYYFLVSSLPLLLFETEKLPALGEFLDTCREQMTGEDFNALKSCRLGDPAPNPDLPAVVREYQQWYRTRQNLVARLRSKKLGREEEKYSGMETGDLTLQEAVKKAVEDKSPLQGEGILDRAAWEELSRLELGHYFDLSFLCIYYLKLQILHRQAGFDTPRGEKRFWEIHDQIHSQDYALENDQ